MDGEFLARGGFLHGPVSKNNIAELLVGDFVSHARGEAELRHLLAGARPKVGVRDAPAGALGRFGSTTATLARAWAIAKVFTCWPAQCGTSYPELDPAPVPTTPKHGQVGTCVGTGLRRRASKRKDDSADDDNQRAGRVLPAEEAEVEGLADAPCPECHGTRLNATARSVEFDSQTIAHRRRLERAPGARVGRRFEARRA